MNKLKSNKIDEEVLKRVGELSEHQTSCTCIFVKKICVNPLDTIDKDSIKGAC